SSDLPGLARGRRPARARSAGGISAARTQSRSLPVADRHGQPIGSLPGGRLAAQQPAADIAHPGGLPRPQRHLLSIGAAAGGTAPDPPPAPRPERKGKRTAVRPAVARQPARIARRARRALAGAPVAVSPAGSRSAPGGSGQ